jgi:dTDP-4-amino-4,6-dideoxygalactose transaminase
VEFIDLQAQFTRLEPVVRTRMDAVLAHKQFIMGPEVKELEDRLKILAGARHCLTCASGSTALDLILMAWGVGPGDAVFTTPFTFVATVESIARTGATPIFADITLADYNIDAACLERAIEAVNTADSSKYPLPEMAGSRKLCPRAIVTVDLFGHPADYDVILDIARRHNLLVLEDGAQSFGGMCKDRPACGKEYTFNDGVLCPVEAIV